MSAFQRGAICFEQRRIARAVEYFRRGLQAGENPECAAQERWMTMMLAGDFEGAWRESDRVLALRNRSGETCDHLPRHLRFVWRGESLRNRDVLVRCYHGLGDVIQFIRFMPDLARVARSVQVHAAPALLPVLQSANGIDALHSLDDAAPPHEAAIELMEVPHALRCTLATVPRKIPYLQPDPALVDLWRQRLPRGPAWRVGLTWASGEWRPERSLPLNNFGFLETHRVAPVGLQRGPAALARDLGALQFAHADWTNDSVADTAAIVRNLDLVISTDTMVAHLAGALGIPVWTLLPFHADWRWLVDRSDSPWYPTMRLYRQQTPGDWTEPLAELRRDFNELVRRDRKE